MTEQEAREDLHIIRSMLEKTRKATAESGALFIVWGVLISLALIGNYVLGSLKLYQWEWLNWSGITVIGWVYSAIYGYRAQRTGRVVTYAQIAARHIYIGCGAGFLLVGLIFPAVGVYTYEAITILISAVTGIMFFTLGGIFEWRFLVWIGLLWWAGAVGMSFVAADARVLIYTGLFIAGFLVPAFLFRAKYRQNRSR
jgi:hypothetical protein